MMGKGACEDGCEGMSFFGTGHCVASGSCGRRVVGGSSRCDGMTGAMGDIIAILSWAWTVRMLLVVLVRRTETGQRLGGDICCWTGRPILEEMENCKFVFCCRITPVSA